MIKELFLPDNIKNYYLFKKRIAAIDITKTQINTCLISLYRDKKIIEQIIETPIIPGPTSSLHERTLEALIQLKSNITNYDELVTIIPSYLTVTKELKLPLEEREKISLILGFEMEPLLPFARQDTILDFIITKKIPSEHSTEIMVAAIQKNNVLDHIALYEAAGLTPSRTVIDIFILYEMYTIINNHNTLNEPVVIIDIGLNSIQIAYIIDNQLKAVRSINHGISLIAKTFSTLTMQNPNQAIEHIMRYGLKHTENIEHNKTMEKAVDGLWQEINFTLDIFTRKNNQKKIAMIFFAGISGQINGLIEYITAISHTPCHELSINQFIQQAQLHTTLGQKITSNALISIGAALPKNNDYDCNLLKEIVKPTNNNILLYFITSISIAIISTLLLLSVTQLRLKKINTELTNSKTEVIEKLKKELPSISDQDTDLDDVLSSAQQLITKEENTWFAFSHESHPPILEYLLELTNNIDKIATGFQPHSIIINEKMIILNASVRDYDALKIFERDLKRSKLFKNTEPRQVDYTNFTMKFLLTNQSNDKQ